MQKKICITLSIDNWKYLNDKAKEEKVSVDTFLSEIIEDCIDHNQTEET